MAITLGFQFTDSMSGNYHRHGDEKPFRFQATARAASVREFWEQKKAKLDGTVDAPGLATDKHLTGELTIDPFDRHLIRYEFEFQGDDGETYKFVGQKNLAGQHLVQSLSKLHGQITGGHGHTWGVALKP